MAAPAVVRVLMATAACQSGLEGTWSGYKGSEGPISLTFGGDHSPTMVSSGGDSVSSIPGGPSVGYETLDEVYPMQLYMVLEMDDRRRREPLGICEIEGPGPIQQQPQIR